MLRLFILTAVLFYFAGRPAPALSESVTHLLLDKSERSLKLMNGSRVVRQYVVALGAAPDGPKQCQGDEKTPEGDYRITGRNPNSAFYRSLRISYPSASDKQRAAALGCSPGGDIMIHGLPNGRGWLGKAHRALDWTDGCIAVTNAEMDQIWQLVPAGTPITITP